MLSDGLCHGGPLFGADVGRIQQRVVFDQIDLRHFWVRHLAHLADAPRQIAACRSERAVLLGHAHCAASVDHEHSTWSGAKGEGRPQGLKQSAGEAPRAYRFRGSCGWVAR
eukprot:scaffold273081_cov26-Tisochrysis_lutea.AAC.1